MVRWSDLRQVNFYDAFHVGLDVGNQYESDVRTGSLRIFGNANIGNAQITNLQVPGQIVLDDDQSVFVQRWYARTELDLDMTAVKRWSENVQVTFTIGYRPQWQLSLADLLRRRPQYVDDRYAFDPFPMLLWPRQDFSVSIDAYNGEACDALTRELRPYPFQQPDGGRRSTWSWIHLEGVIAKNTKLEPMLDLAFKKHRTAEERIQHWLLGMVGEDEAANAQIMAIHDGIEEGKHRK